MSLFDGIKEAYYPSGRLRTRESFEQGKLHGLVELYWPNGKLKRRLFFTRGKREGDDLVYAENGVLIDQSSFQNGEPVGVHRRYSSSGALLEEHTYLAPCQVNVSLWNEEGELTFSRTWQGDRVEEIRLGQPPRRGCLQGGRLVWD